LIRRELKLGDYGGELNTGKINLWVGITQWKGTFMMRSRRGGKQRRQELALLAMAIAIKEENVQRGIETITPKLPTMPSATSRIQSPDREGGHVPLEV